VFACRRVRVSREAVVTLASLPAEEVRLRVARRKVL